MFKCFTLTAKGIIITPRHQIYFHMFDVANAGFEMPIPFSVLASVNSSAHIHPPEYISIHFMPAGDTATKHGKMDKVPRIFTHEPRALEIPWGSKTQVWRYPVA